MIIGNPAVFAIESKITEAYDCLHFIALGYFSIHIQDQQYGVVDPYATFFGNPLQEVEGILEKRGKHTFDFICEFSGTNIADAYRLAFYCDENDEKHADKLAIQLSKQDEFRENAYVFRRFESFDRAFDDGSYIVYFDVGDRVRLIGFQINNNNNLHIPATLRDLWLPADEFYSILQEWHDYFDAQWTTMQKTSTEGLPPTFKVDE